MKKILLSLILGLGLAFFTVMEAAAAQPAAIRVHGHSKIEADPEVAFLTVKFTASDPKDTSKARMQLERIFSGVIARLRQLNIRDGDLVAQDIETSGNHDAQSKCGQNEEYSVFRSLTVSVYDLSMLDRVVDIVLDGQSNAEIRNVSFGLLNRGKYADQARELAIQDSISQAVKVASRYNAKITRVQNIEYSQNTDLVTPDIQKSIGAANGDDINYEELITFDLIGSTVSGMMPQMGTGQSVPVQQPETVKPRAYFKVRKITVTNDVNVTFELDPRPMKY